MCSVPLLYARGGCVLCLYQICDDQFPLYWISAHIGAHAGCVLVDRILEVVDPELHGHLIKYKLSSAYLYAFSSVSSLSASAPPFKELLKLWDFLITFGPHFNILCVVAQVISLRDKILKTEQPEQILNYRKWPRLRAKFIISVAMSLLPQLPSEIYDQMCAHGTDPAVASALTGREFSIHNNDSPKHSASYPFVPTPLSTHGNGALIPPSLTIGENKTPGSTPSTTSSGVPPTSPKQLSLAPPSSVSPSVSPSFSPASASSSNISTISVPSVSTTTLSSTVPKQPVSPRGNKSKEISFTISSS